MARAIEFNECEKIDKAMNVFWEKGYNGTSMQDLVDAMQINRSSLYNTIGDKHQLFMKCISNYFDNAMKEIREKVAKETSAKQALINVIKDKAGWIVDCEKGCLGIKTIFEIAPEDNEVRNLMNKNNNIFLDFLAETVQKAMDDGEMDKSEDASLMAEYIMTSFTGWKQSYILHRDPIKIKKMSEFLIKNIFK
ncbi:MAG: TetR family transcriptional regulator [Flavobacterium sp. BFFFF1]|uniref:TetR/AcrR family transcriptional regulator n=1 Tax=Flavobacterium sp. BFFFF1 TaxID=2015557 RepID=UPI000BCE73A6|nr:TetR/AcrR family transcriptional regulator [Flavobacterium sp. BFFFF1]OYU79966.1 MAG: TetR family transcriptional regulator [Flavobacterium sp. BFFFF1]